MSTSATSHLLPVFARVDLGFERGEGCWLIATNGDRYLDFTSGVAVNALGHCHPHLVAALQEQATKLWHMSNLFKSPDGEVLAARLCEQSFADFVFFCNSGAEAMEGVIKLVRHYHFSKGHRRALSHHHLRRRLPRPHAGDAGRHRLGQISRGFWPADGRLRPGAAWRPRRREEGDRPAHRRHPDRAGAGRGRRALGAAFLLQGAARALRPARPAARLRRGADRHGPLRRSLRLPARSASRRMSCRSPRRLAAAFRSARCWRARRRPPAWRRARTARPSAAIRLRLRRRTPCSTSCSSPASSITCRRCRCCLKQKLASVVDRYPSVLSEVRGEGLLVGVKAVVPSGDLVAALRDQKLLTVGAGDNVVRFLRAADRHRSRDRALRAVPRARLRGAVGRTAEEGGGVMTQAARTSSTSTSCRWPSCATCWRPAAP